MLYLLPDIFFQPRHEMQWVGHCYENKKIHTVVWLENVRRRALFRCLHLDGTIMLKLTFEKQLVMRIGLKWLRIGLCNSLWRIIVSWPRKFLSLSWWCGLFIDLFIF